MSERSDEATANRDRSAAAADDLVEETDRLLSETGAGDSSAASSRSSPIDGEPATGFGDSGPGRDGGRESAAEAEPGSSRSWPSLRPRLSPITSRLSIGRYFSPKAFLALVLALGIGLVAGATVLPFAGRAIGMFATAFAAGLIGSKRRYLETSAAGVSVGGVAAVVNHAVIALAGSGRALVAVGATVGLIAAVGGYYLGRDLRDGLSRDV